MNFTDSSSSENLEAFLQLASMNNQSNSESGQIKPNIVGDLPEEAESQLNSLVESLSKQAPDAIDLSPEAVANLQQEASKVPTKDVSDKSDNETASPVPKDTKITEVPKESKTSDEKDCVLFTCGHHFTAAEFKVRIIINLSDFPESVKV